MQRQIEHRYVPRTSFNGSRFTPIYMQAPLKLLLTWSGFQFRQSGRGAADPCCSNRGLVPVQSSCNPQGSKERRASPRRRRVLLLLFLHRRTAARGKRSETKRSETKRKDGASCRRSENGSPTATLAATLPTKATHTN
ncbi:uncharacterized protein LOC124416527 [Diprion similis]|uniref:uncharacterized protein LOC124416527 n=1 Tax=Diprion similis TaxID=362088 RepID=UPI001EF7DBF3|nr:uncharacterized protein LOC124416527 [Diprion similis]